MKHAGTATLQALEPLLARVQEQDALVALAAQALEAARR